METSDIIKIKTPYQGFFSFSYGDKKQLLGNFSRWNHPHLHNINGFTEDEKLWYFHPIAFVQHLRRIFDQVVFPFYKVKNGDFDAAGFLTENSRKFGSIRYKDDSPYRAHAGVDLYAPPGTEILAVNDGIITDHRAYLTPEVNDVEETVYALTVDHGDFVVRYCEISNSETELPNDLKEGSNVKKGQVIAHVGEIKWESGNVQSMLHFEKYDSGVPVGSWYQNASSKICSSNNLPFKRHTKLTDPTEFLKKLL